MAKGSSSQASTNVSSGASGADAARAGAIKRNTGSAAAVQRPSSSSRAAPSRAGNAGQFTMYTEDAPGLRVQPQTVLIMSLVFIGTVVLLHIYGKFTRAGGAK